MPKSLLASFFLTFRIDHLLIIMNINKQFDITDSPQLKLQLFHLSDDISQSYQLDADETPSFSKKTKSYQLKIPHKKVQAKPIRSKPLVLRNVDGVLPEQLHQMCGGKLSIYQIEKHLRNLQNVDILWETTINNIKAHHPIFKTPLDFSFYDGDQIQKEEFTQEIIKLEEDSILINSVGTSEVAALSSSVCKINFSDSFQQLIPIDQRLKIIKLKKYYTVLKRKINKYLQTKRSKLENNHFHICKYCGASFSTGRQLGGHMSRRHNGKSSIYKHKTEIHKINVEERNRRKHIRKVRTPTIKVKITPAQQQILSGVGLSGVLKIQNQFEDSSDIFYGA